MGEFEETRRAQVVYREELSFPKWFMGVMGVFLGVSIVAIIAQIIIGGDNLGMLLGTLFVVLGAAFIVVTMRTLRVMVSAQNIAVNYGVWKLRIPIRAIVKCEPTTYTFLKYGGYGIRFSVWDQSWALNIPGDQQKAVRIHYTKRSGGIRKLLISSKSPEEFADAVNNQRRLTI